MNKERKHELSAENSTAEIDKCFCYSIKYEVITANDV
jgi:hypothetical protein